MSLLDKHTMYYFRDELEKTALIVKALQSFGQIVASAGKSAAKGAKHYGDAMTRASAIGHKGPLTAKHYIGAGLLGGGGIYAGVKGTKHGINEYKRMQVPVNSNSGIQNINSGGY